MSYMSDIAIMIQEAARWHIPLTLADFRKDAYGRLTIHGRPAAEWMDDHTDTAMWTGRCTGSNRDGSQCRRASTMAYWAFEFQGWMFEQPRWVETCNHPAHRPTRIMAEQDIRWVAREKAQA